ncbi:MAG TPA: LD-carboxypeptidase [Thermoanaerobaculia bacterium]|nr:LD-carboxypeptidase [Thermoanaerobaculia bacterium]
MILPAQLPPPAGPGDRVGVAALSGVIDPVRLDAGVAALRRLGFEPVLAANLRFRSPEGLFAGTDAERLDAFHRLAADPAITAIFFARGGHGLLRVLPALDWDLLRRRPRAYVGYSDLTPFLLELARRLGLVGFHGPLVAGELARGLSPEEEDSLLGALAGRYPAEQPFGRWLREPEGEVRGTLLGGCLSLLTATLGTPFAPDLQGGIVFWEEINEPPYRVDRMLTHLGLSGNLANIAGMIVGHIGNGQGPNGAPADWPALVGGSVAGYSWPLAWGLESGHLAPNRTLPVGLPARLEDGRLVLGEG